MMLLINNINRLVTVWSHNLNHPRGSESQPIIDDVVMYVTTYSTTVAIDAFSGKQLWKADLNFPADIAKTVCLRSSKHTRPIPQTRSLESVQTHCLEIQRYEK